LTGAVWQSLQSLVPIVLWSKSINVQLTGE
jgi:hypothetical protein